METKSKRYHGPATVDGKPAVDEILRQAWYNDNVVSIPANARALLQEYSGLEAEEVIPHVVALRDKAFAIWSYACIGQMRFLAYNLSLLPFYSKVLARLRSGATFLDAGCCFGQEIRYLVRDGVPSAQLYAFDLEPEFLDLGFQLFRDRDNLQATFAAGDILASPGNPQSGDLMKLQGKADIVFASSFLHVWDWDDQVAAVKNLIAMTRLSPGTMIVGKQLGSTEAGRYKMPTASGFNYRHNVESMKRFWAQVGKETKSSWSVEAAIYDGYELTENKGHAWSEPGMCMVWFSATRE